MRKFVGNHGIPGDKFLLAFAARAKAPGDYALGRGC